MKYKGGVLQKSCAAKANLIDHCVQLVGYNKTATPPWWKIRNSWGTVRSPMQPPRTTPCSQPRKVERGLPGIPWGCGWVVACLVISKLLPLWRAWYHVPFSVAS